jgi:hypothetical protein
MQKVSLTAISRFTDHWSPNFAGDINGMQIKPVMLPGEFVIGAWVSL